MLPAESGAFYPTPQTPVAEIQTSTGLKVWVNDSPTDRFKDRVWNAPLPNAPLSEIDPVEVRIPPLRPRREGHLKDGFRRTWSP
jgi:hypothetical protein